MPMPEPVQDTKFEFLGEATLDERNRLSLTKALEVLRSVMGKDVKRLRFAILANRAGQILLSPEVPIPLHEAWLYKNKAALASVLRGIKEAERGEAKAIGSFARFADDETP